MHPQRDRPSQKTSSTRSAQLPPGGAIGSSRFLRFFRYLNWHTICKTIRAAGEQRLPGLAAEMAYNAMLSLFPAILAILTAIGLFRPLQVTFAALASQLSEVVPAEALWLIQGFADAVSGTRDRGLFSISFVLALWIASGALSAAMAALDQIHCIPRQLVRPFWKARLIALGLTIGTILLLLLAVGLLFVSDVAVRNVAEYSGSFRFGLLRLWQLLTFPLVLGIMSLTFGFIYRYGPSRWSPGQPIMPGAVLAAVLWAIISNLFRLYVQHFGNYNQVYGTVGAVIVLMLWLYLSSLVLLIGDQLNVTVGRAMRPGQGRRRRDRGDRGDRGVGKNREERIERF
ncbi:YihY/virulence factor BrkB family protein [Leptolyngbya sp. NK1-12]|uniref:YihY/virulence factor BrkB family protein n=1 Tax=Leptolyngbya sp. NK1-12 TaxID=2547451 RepID=UPI00292D3B71|nr:YihY/virulence factor BrkB family protein [Leptolyngbya sp. NK1-12]